MPLQTVQCEDTRIVGIQINLHFVHRGLQYSKRLFDIWRYIAQHHLEYSLVIDASETHQCRAEEQLLNVGAFFNRYY